MNFIIVLSRLGVPLKTPGSAEGERDPESMLDLLEQQEKLLDMKLRELRESYSITHTRRKLIRQGLKADPAAISVCTMPKRTIIWGPRNVF